LLINVNTVESKYKRKFDDFLAFLFICLLFNIFAYGNEYAYKTYEYIRKLAYYENLKSFYRMNSRLMFNGTSIVMSLYYRNSKLTDNNPKNELQVRDDGTGPKTIVGSIVSG